MQSVSKLLDFTDFFSLSQLIHDATRVTDTKRQYSNIMCVANTTPVGNVKVIPGSSDHCIPFVDMIRLNPKGKRNILLFDTVNAANINSGHLKFVKQVSSNDATVCIQSLCEGTHL